MSQFFTVEEKPVSKTQEFFIEEKGESVLEKKVVSSLKEGHELNLNKNCLSFKLKTGADLKELKTSLDRKVKTDEKALKHLMDAILKKANLRIKEDFTREDLKYALGHIVQVSGKQKELVSLADLTGGVLKGDMAPLQQKNPFLTDNDLAELRAKMAELFILGSRIKQEKQALEIISKAKAKSFDDLDTFAKQSLGEVLNRKRAYEYREYPEFLVYEYVTGFMLRPGQVELLKWVIDNLENEQLDHMICQFAAGGGKTKVIIPLLAFRVAHKLKKLPVVMNISSLYSTGVDDLSVALQTSFNQNLEVIEKDISDVFTTKDLEKLEKDLVKWKKEGKCVMIKAVTWHSLNVQWKMALSNGDEKKETAALRVLNFLEENGLLFADEAHRIMSSLQETNRAFGDLYRIPLDQQEVFLRFYEMIVGVEKTALSEKTKDKYDLYNQEVRKLAKKVKLRTNEQSLCEDVKEMRETLAKLICEESCFADVPNKKDLHEYLNSTSTIYPEWLDDLYEIQDKKSIANRIIAAHQFLHTTLPHVLSLRGKLDYGESESKVDRSASPRHDGKPVNAKFAVNFVACALTIQTLFQENVNAEKFSCRFGISSLLKKMHEKERESGILPPYETKVEKFVMAKWKDKNTLPKTLDQYNWDENADLLAKNIGDNPKLIREYLVGLALNYVKTPIFKSTSNATDLIKGFSKTIGFTATPGIVEQYPAEFSSKGKFDEKTGNFQSSSFRPDYGFEAQVVESLLQKENNKVLIVPDLSRGDDIEEWFDQVYDRDHEAFKALTNTIDRGGIFREFENEDIVRGYLKSAKKHQLTFNGGLCFMKPPEGGDEKLAYMSSSAPNNPVFLEGTNVIEAFKKIGLDFYKLKLFTHFDLSHTTGTDIKLDNHAKGGLTLGEEQNQTSTVQAVMRQRQFLLEEGQTSVWLISESIAKKVASGKKGELTPQDIHRFLIQNEAKAIEKTLMLRAYQNIKRIIDDIAWDKIKNKKDSRIRIRDFEKFKKGLQETIETEPYKLYGKKKSEIRKQNTEAILNEYALNCYEKLGFTDKSFNELPNEGKQQLELIIEQTIRFIKKSRDYSDVNMRQEMVQEQVQVQEQKQKQEQELQQESVDRYTEGEPKVEEYSDAMHSLTNTGFLEDPFLEKNKAHYMGFKQLLPSFKKDFPPIIFSKEYVGVTKSSDTYLRPIQHFLVKTSADSIRTMPITTLGAQYYAREIYQNKNKETQNKYLIIGFNGDALYQGSATDEDLTSLKNSNQLKHTLIFSRLLTGKILEPEDLVSLVEEYNWEKTDLEMIWNFAQEKYISSRPPDTKKYQEALELLGWKEGTQQLNFRVGKTGVGKTASVKIPKNEYKFQLGMKIKC